jgi:hypothetical protein
MSRLNFASTLIAAAVLLPMAQPAFAAPRETDAVFLAELKLRVCDADYAATGSTIRATLTYWGAYTTLDYPRNDFQRGTEFTYVMSLDGLRTFADIQELSIGNLGTDQLCLDRIQLIVNGSLIFERLGEVRLDSAATRAINIGHSELRSHPLWVNWHQEFGRHFDLALLNRIVAAGVATGMYGPDAGYSYSYSWYGTHNPLINAVTTPQDERLLVHVDLEFRRRCVDPMTGASTNCRMFVLSGEFILSVTCLGPIGVPSSQSYMQESGVKVRLISGMSNWLYQQLWEASTQRDMHQIAEAAAKAFGRQPSCKVFDL